MVCFLPGFFFFFFFFYRYFPCQTLTIQRITGKGEEIIIFLVFHFHLLTNIHLVHRDFYYLFLINLFVITRADEIFVLLRDLHFTYIFIDAIKSKLLTLTIESDIFFSIWVFFHEHSRFIGLTLWGFELISK